MKLNKWKKQLHVFVKPVQLKYHIFKLKPTMHYDYDLLHV